MACECTCKNCCCCKKPVEERIVCEAGFFWRRVCARFEEKVNSLMKQGWTTRGYNIDDNGCLRRRLMVVLKRGKHAD